MARVQQQYFVRFSLVQRLEHLLMMLAFIALAVTGLPQKYPDARWAEWIVLAVGGIDQTRAIHRVFAVLLTFVALEHVGTMTVLVLLGRARASMIPDRKDFGDAIQNLEYYLGLAPTGPQFDHFDYKQKFEYWGLLLGGATMISSGFVLWFPALATRYLPGVIIPVAKVLHTNEAMLALLVVVVWHIYGAHLSPEVFPADTTIFTGKISRARLKHEHYLEYLRLTADENDESRSPPEESAEPVVDRAPAPPGAPEQGARPGQSR